MGHRHVLPKWLACCTVAELPPPAGLAESERMMSRRCCSLTAWPRPTMRWGCPCAESAEQWLAHELLIMQILRCYQSPCNQSAAQLHDVGMACKTLTPRHTQAWVPWCPHTRVPILQPHSDATSSW